MRRQHMLAIEYHDAAVYPVYQYSGVAEDVECFEPTAHVQAAAPRGYQGQTPA